MPFVQELRELENLPSAYPFLSLYLDVGHTEESAEEMRVFARNHLRQALAQAGNARERSYLEIDARHITAYLEDVIHARVERKAHGLAIFSCARKKIFHVVSSPEPLPTVFEIGERPHLEPLLQYSASEKRILACLVDSRSARILEIGPGNVFAQAEIQSRVGRRHHQGGWSQMRFQRHVDDQVEHHYRDVCNALTHLSDREPQVAIVVAGPEQIVQSFRDHLPERVRQRVLAGMPASLKTQERDLVAQILRTYERGQESRLEEEVEKNLEEAMTPAHGARGIQEVLRAANEHAIRQLFVPSNLDARGWRCQSCGALGLRVPLSCGFCGGTIESTDVHPELVSKVLGSGGEVFTLPSDRDVTRGVVARLRYHA